LAAGVAHEINNPLGSILLFSRLLLQKAPADEVMRGNLQRIEKETKRCQNIVQGLLEFSRQREPKMENVDVNDLLVKTLVLFENQAMFHNIRIEKEFEPRIPPVTIDPAQVQQVFVNIIINAADAMNGKGRLTVHTRFVEDNRMVEIAFSDTGCGIPAEQIDKIFEPFYTTKAVGYGTGLGLSISLGIIQRHGGTIRISSAVGTGTTFFIRLPGTSDKS
ncbi:MAG: hypothetical protein JXA18_10490, partial [Chitinispirillaceae bacterium]|nr:hypothetical protein [Chitinispirillaceae bacterium]